MLSGVLLV